MHKEYEREAVLSISECYDLIDRLKNEWGLTSEFEPIVVMTEDESRFLGHLATEYGHITLIYSPPKVLVRAWNI